MGVRGEVTRTLGRLCADTSGAVLSIEMILISTVVIIGLLAGLSAYRDAIVQELGDSAAGVASLQQSFSVQSVSLSGRYGDIPYDSFVSGSTFTDRTDFCEEDLDPDGAPPMCIEISAETVQNES